MTYYSCFDHLINCQTKEDINVLKKMGNQNGNKRNEKRGINVCSLTGSPSDYNEDY